MKIKILAIETSCDETAAAVILSKSQITNHKSQSKNDVTEYPEILSSVVSSQVDLHKKTGGVVPEVASRAHMESMIAIINEALIIGNHKSQITKHKIVEGDLFEGITHIAVTAGPGLIGSLLVGFNTAKALAYALNVPIVPVNHIEGHIYSALTQSKTNNEKLITKNCGVIFPVLALTVSGGHTSLTLMRDHGKYLTIGSTRDDAAGEAFDKVAKLLGLGYPGGPVVSRMAQSHREKITKRKSPHFAQRATTLREDATDGTARGRQIINKRCNNTDFPHGLSTDNSDNNETMKQYNNGIIFPRPMINDKSYDFSFSGLKTAVLNCVRELTTYDLKLTTNQKQNICFAFEDAVVDVLVFKTLRAVHEFKPKTVALAGGVAANSRLREELTTRLQNSNIEYRNTKQIRNSNEQNRANSNIRLLIAPMDLCGDNGAMIGLAAYYHILRGDVSSWNKIRVDSNMKLR